MSVQVALVMVLLEVRTGWFFIYFFTVFLYIGGLFDPLIEWFQQYSSQAESLRRQLHMLIDVNHAYFREDLCSTLHRQGARKTTLIMFISMLNMLNTWGNKC